jgi:hypothetical protein
MAQNVAEVENPDNNENIEKEWTIMLYFSGDNNLSLEMAYALEQIKAVTQGNNNINLYVYFDGFSCDVPTLYCDFSDPTNFYKSSNIGKKLIEVKDKFNENSAEVNNIINFVNWCVEKDPKEKRKKKKYAFIFSGHSFGFLNWGLFKDENANYTMTHAKLVYMFERITDTEDVLLNKAIKEEAKYEKRTGKKWSEKYRRGRTTEIIGKKLDLLGFDSCVMSTLEIGCQFQHYAKTMVASEGSIPNAGWNYAQILLGRIKENSNKPKTEKSREEEIAVSFVDEFIKQQNKFALADISVDIAAWDLNKLGGSDGLESSLFGLADNLLTCFKDENATIYKQMRRLLVNVHWQCQTYMFEQHIDLGDFCHLLKLEIDSLQKELINQDIKPITAVGKSCQKVLDKIRESIIITGFSGSDFQFSNGVSLFFPWSWASYNICQEDYEKLTFINGNKTGKRWNKFLKKFLGEVTFRPSNPLTETDNDGNIVVSKISDSVVYKSYVNIDPTTKDGINLFGYKQPPDGPKQPPDGPKQPPDGPKMFSMMDIFMSHFKKLKNFESNWNHTGFTSTKVLFVPKTDNQQSQQPAGGGKIEVRIPKGFGIGKRIDKVFAKLQEFDKENQINDNLSIYRQLLKAIFENLGEPSILDLLNDLDTSNFFALGNDQEDQLRAIIENICLISINLIEDDKVRDGILKDFNNIS